MIVMAKTLARRSLEYAGLILLAVTIPVSILAFTMLDNTALGTAALTGSFIGAVLLALAPVSSEYTVYGEWVSENTVCILRSILEHLGVREYELVAYPSSKAGGEPCVLYAPRGSKPPESLPEGVVVGVEGGFGLKLKLRIPSEYLPAIESGGGEALVSEFTVNYLGVSSNATVVESGGCYIVSLGGFNAYSIEFVEAAIALILAESSGRIMSLRESRLQDGVLTLKYCGVES